MEGRRARMVLSQSGAMMLACIAGGRHGVVNSQSLLHSRAQQYGGTVREMTDRPSNEADLHRSLST